MTHSEPESLTTEKEGFSKSIRIQLRTSYCTNKCDWMKLFLVPLTGFGSFAYQIRKAADKA